MVDLEGLNYDPSVHRAAPMKYWNNDRWQEAQLVGHQTWADISQNNTTHKYLLNVC